MDFGFGLYQIYCETNINQNQTIREPKREKKNHRSSEIKLLYCVALGHILNFWKTENIFEFFLFNYGYFNFFQISNFFRFQIFQISKIFRFQIFFRYQIFQISNFFRFQVFFSFFKFQSFQHVIWAGILKLF